MPNPRPTFNSTPQVTVQYTQADPTSDYSQILPCRYLVTVSREDGSPMQSKETYWALRESVGIIINAEVLSIEIKKHIPVFSHVLAKIEKDAHSLKAAKADEPFQLILAKIVAS